MASVRVRPVWVAVLLLILVASSGGVASAHGDKILWRVYPTKCNRTSQSAGMTIREQGSTGVTWMRMTASFQYFSNGAWHTQQSKYFQNKVQFRDTHADHSLNWTKAFGYRGPTVTHTTRIWVKFEWWRNQKRLATRYRSSLLCVP